MRILSAALARVLPNAVRATSDAGGQEFAYLHGHLTDFFS
jgi:hypothetical protein